MLDGPLWRHAVQSGRGFNSQRVVSWRQSLGVVDAAFVAHHYGRSLRASDCHPDSLRKFGRTPQRLTNHATDNAGAGRRDAIMQHAEIDLSSRDLELQVNEAGWRPPLSGSNRESESLRSNAQRETLFFPLPFNDEQEEVIRRLEAQDSPGVTVQGPPGTGKTHTIANIISHFLATRRRVLVTAKTPEALRALQEKIPEGIRDLAISVIHNDREGGRQLQHAVQVLADEAKSIDVRFVTEQIRDKQARLGSLRDQIEKIDRVFQHIAEQNLARLDYEGKEVNPMGLARLVAEQREQHRWFPR